MAHMNPEIPSQLCCCSVLHSNTKVEQKKKTKLSALSRLRDLCLHKIIDLLRMAGLVSRLGRAIALCIFHRWSWCSCGAIGLLTDKPLSSTYNPDRVGELCGYHHVQIHVRSVGAQLWFLRGFWVRE